jgi:glycerophosphoryl diester phosphodiesterase
MITAHRGNSVAALENTMAAFTLALDLGVNAIETDIHLTSDGVPMLIHDADLARTAGLDSAVAALTLADLQQVDVGSWMSDEFRGETVPSLTDLARRCRDNRMASDWTI